MWDVGLIILIFFLGGFFIIQSEGDTGHANICAADADLSDCPQLPLHRCLPAKCVIDPPADG